MNKELKKAIANYMFENSTEFQLINVTVNKFRQYIYTETGDFCLGGGHVSQYIQQCYKLINY